ncbi:uncharacterized protein SPPG_02549 [Spizellomyces punctatus DAOM BR117]|uniref:Threonine/serine exporter-like N-terminal domain-containing protein n=1 Tax=Spizellomyces punctatus (strain DAOM BR117) TaxID=645134 RepID=A0A0L0HM99_SPIPD|nr:uncharacterized protein SPPG_02549 [Spizellomyces punctatus DAOM BR117]KND02045.1 hypothetical protein SPPG_02549 [Spizellomyces punctatus DAOM BR117]|eukprot:XP_016610084.1 hypothetical protein SPPG_02549 [Spizellomyces punctatus DAOM BR117]
MDPKLYATSSNISDDLVVNIDSAMNQIRRRSLGSARTDANSLVGPASLSSKHQTSSGANETYKEGRSSTASDATCSAFGSLDNLVRSPDETSSDSLSSNGSESGRLSPTSILSSSDSLSRPSVASDARVRFQLPGDQTSGTGGKTSSAANLDNNDAGPTSKSAPPGAAPAGGTSEGGSPGESPTVSPTASPPESPPADSSPAVPSANSFEMLNTARHRNDSLHHMLMQRRLHQHISTSDMLHRTGSLPRRMADPNSSSTNVNNGNNGISHTSSTGFKNPLPTIPSFFGPDLPPEEHTHGSHLSRCLTCGSMPDVHDMHAGRRYSINGSLHHLPVRRSSAYTSSSKLAQPISAMSSANPLPHQQDIERSTSMTADEVLSLHEQIYGDAPNRNTETYGAETPLKRRWKSTATMFTGMSKAQRVKTRDFLMGLAKAFARYGAPSHRIEYQLELVALALEQPGSFVVIPGVIWVSFGDEDHTSSTHLIKVGQSWHMHKLSLVNYLCRNLIAGEIDIFGAIDRLAEIASEPDYPPWYDLITYPMISFTLCLIGFGAGWLDAAVSAVLGLAVGGFSLLSSSRFREFTHLVPFLSATFCSFMSRVVFAALRSHRPEICYNHVSVVLSGIVMMLPGLSITVSMIEIATRNIVSGTVRVFFALFHAMMLGFGISTGRALVTWGPDDLDTSTPVCPGPLHPLWNFLFFPPLCACFILNFQARRPQFLHISIISTLGWVMYLVLSIPPSFQTATGQIVPNIISAFAIGVSANIYARWTKDVAVPAIICGIVMMVPGSMGVRATLGFFGSNATNAVQVVFQMLMIGMSIGIGLFLASLVVFPIKGTRYKYMTI